MVITAVAGCTCPNGNTETHNRTVAGLYLYKRPLGDKEEKEDEEEVAEMMLSQSTQRSDLTIATDTDDDERDPQLSAWPVLQQSAREEFNAVITG